MRDIEELLANDIDQDFLDLIRTEFAGAYAQAYWDRAAPPGEFIARENEVLQQSELQSLRFGRRGLGNNALLRACHFAEVPSEMRFLPCNGQRFAVARMNRILLIQDVLTHTRACPATADYKKRLAASALAVRQLEFDFKGDKRARIDASNTILMTVLHGWAGTSFTQSGTALTELKIAIADERYENWLWIGNVLDTSIGARLGWTKAVSGPLLQTDAVTVRWRDSEEEWG